MTETQSLPQENKVPVEKKEPPDSLKTATFSVREGDLLKLRATAIDIADSVSERALVCAIRFFDLQGGHIEQAYDGTAVSSVYGSYVYVESKKEGEAASWIKQVIVAPAGAHLLEVKLYPWKTSPEITITGEVECLDIRRIPTDEISWNLGASEAKSETYEVLPFWRSLFSFDILRKANAALNDILINIKFVGVDGSLTPVKTAVISPVMGTTHALESDELVVTPVAQKCEYEGYERLIALAQITPPSTAVTAIVTVSNQNEIYSVRVAQRIFAFEKLIESRLSADAGTYISRAVKLPADLAQLSFTKLAEKRPDDVSVFDGILEYYVATGNAKKMIATANTILNRFQDGSVCAKARRALALVNECMPSWRPSVAGLNVKPAATEKSGPPLKVGYFLRNVDVDNDWVTALGWDAMCAQKTLSGGMPFAILPLGFPHKGERGLPWERHEVGEIACYYLNCLSLEQLEAIPVTSQLNFMTVVAGDVLNREQADLLHVQEGERGYDLALVALALSKSMHLPLVYQKSSPFVLPADGSLSHQTLAQLRATRDYQCMLDADAVIVSADVERASLMAVGIAAEKVFVWPAGGEDVISDTELYREKIGALCRCVYAYAQSANQRKYT